VQRGLSPVFALGISQHLLSLKPDPMKRMSIVLFTLSTLLLFNNCQSGSSTDYSSAPFEVSVPTQDRPLTEQELKEQLRGKECSNATKYLDGNLKYSPIYKNALSMKVKGLKIKCVISNRATLATFKDMKAHVEFTSKTGAKIFERSFDIYEFVGPKGQITYKSEFAITNQQYKDVADFNWTITRASCR
jgi:hypothetical protein